MNAIVTSVDQEHLEHYGSFDNLLAAFEKFIKKVPEDGIVVLNTKDFYLKN